MDDTPATGDSAERSQPSPESLKPSDPTSSGTDLPGPPPAEALVQSAAEKARALSAARASLPPGNLFAGDAEAKARALIDPSRDESKAAELAAYMDGETRGMLRKMFHHSGIPADHNLRMKGLEFADVRSFPPGADPARYRRAALDIWQMIGRRGAVVVLIGAAGAGKTWLLYSLIRHTILDRMTFGKYMTAGNVYDRFSSARHFASKISEEQVHAELTRYPVVGLDECDKAEGIGTDPPRLRQLIIDRHAQGRSTIVVGNWDAAGATAILGDYVIDRANTNGKVIECGWGKLRVKAVAHA